MQDAPRKTNPNVTLIRAIVILVLLVVAVCGMCYTGWVLYHLPAK